MNKIKLIIGAHGHAPFGSSEEDLESAYQAQYKPFIASLYKYPKVPFVLHHSGVLLAWIEQRHPEYFMLLEELINRKQVEIIGGGFYEPMLPLLPLADRLGQIELLTTYLRKHFGKRPRGCWLPGLIWEQPLVATLQTCGMDYTFLESDQFSQAGLSGPDLERPCLTEDQGKIVTVFPLSRRLTETVLKGDFDGFVQLVAEPVSDGGERTATVFVEGLFNGKPGAEALFCDFLERISRQESAFELSVPSRVLKAASVFSKAYFPSSAEKNVMYWAMSEERRKAFNEIADLGGDSADQLLASCLSGSLPRHFLIRYPEANGIYTKMLYTHILINQLRGDKYRKRAAREDLWKAQGCDGFWHIADGGIYRNRIRKSTYRSLIDAEKITREKGVFIPSVIAVDINLDGEREFLLQGSELNAYVQNKGGSLFELDCLAKSWNYLDTMGRRRESYLEGDQILDELPRTAFADRLLHPEITLKDAVSNTFPYSRNCAAERYDEIATDRVHQEITLQKNAAFSGDFGGIEIRKKYALKKNLLQVYYTLSNRGDAPARFNFAPEIDLSLAGETLESQRVGVVSNSSLSESELAIAEYRGADELIIEDAENDLPISLSSTGPFDLWLIPIRTACRIGGELVNQYQSTCCMPIRPVILAPGECWETRFSLRFGR